MRKRNRRNSSIKRKIIKAIGEPWDWGYMLDLERAKLETMLRYHEKSQLVMDWKIMVRDIKLAINLIDLIKDDGISQTVWIGNKLVDNNAVNRRNAKRFLNESMINSDYPFRNGTLKTEKAWHLYHKLRLYRMRNWWD
ncbi:MAG: hypothetical protein ACRCS6_07010 [Turicibacter sp.]